MQTVGAIDLALAPGIVAYLKMLVTLGALRHQLAPDYDLPLLARRFFERLLRQQGADWLDPRTALDRPLRRRPPPAPDAGLRRAARGAGAPDHGRRRAYFGVRGSLEALRRRVLALGAALVVGAALYVVLANPDGTRAVVPAQVPYTWVHLGLLALLVLLILSLALQGRRSSAGRSEPRPRRASPCSRPRRAAAAPADS